MAFQIDPLERNRYVICSQIVETLLMIIIIGSVIMALIRYKQEKYLSCEQQINEYYRQQIEKHKKYLQQNPVTQNNQQGQKQIQIINYEKQESLLFRISYKSEKFFEELPVLGIVILNILCFSCFEYILISLVVYLVLIIIKFQDFCGIENIYARLIIQKFPILLIVSWYIHLLALPSKNMFP